VQVYTNEFQIPNALGAANPRLGELSERRQQLVAQLRQDTAEFYSLTKEGGIEEAAKQDAADAGAAIVRGEKPGKPGKLEAAAQAQAEKLRLDVAAGEAAIASLNAELFAAIEAARSAGRSALDAALSTAADEAERAFAEYVETLEKLHRVRSERDWLDRLDVEQAATPSRTLAYRFNAPNFAHAKTKRGGGLNGETVQAGALLHDLEQLGRELADRVEEPEYKPWRAERRERGKAQLEETKARHRELVQEQARRNRA
jgi:hypothetical protein